MSENNRYFATLVHGDHILSNSDYAAGRISAAFRILCGEDNLICLGLPRDNDEEETCYVVWTTLEQYLMVKSYINEWYPGLCEFDYFVKNLPAPYSKAYAEED